VYGQTTQTTLSGTPSDNSQQYTGRENDGTGLMYYRARYYAPASSRFISEDPIGWSSGQTNNYAYVSGNPVSLIDPTGLRWIYCQNDGNLYHQPDSGGPPELVGSGYSGSPKGINKPWAESLIKVGPIPSGTYVIGPIGNNRLIGSTGPWIAQDSMYLTPNQWIYGRDRFWIHSGDMVNRRSSEGCIIMNRDVRRRIGTSVDRTLEVTTCGG
jgi:RHS repeat-associated protein